MPATRHLSDSTFDGKGTHNRGVRIIDDDGTAIYNGFRALLDLSPPTADDEVCGLVLKIPDTSWGIGQDYTEGNVIVVLSDADNTVPTPTNLLRTITGTTNATPVVITTSVAHGYSTGDNVGLSGIGIDALDGGANARKWWKITVLSTTTFSLNGSTAPGSTAAVGSVFSDRNATLHRLADTGWGTAGSFHFAYGLRNRAGGVNGGPSFIGGAVWVDPSVDVIGLQINNPSATKWAATPTADYLRITDLRAAGAVRFAVNAAGQTLHNPGNAAAPGISFVGATNSGLWNTGSSVAMGFGGVMAFQVGATGQIFVPEGTLTAPTMAAALDTDTGINISTAGVNIVNGSTAKLSVAVHITVGDAVNIHLGSTTGTKIGTNVAHKLAFWNKTPIVQPSALPAAATDLATVITLANDMRTKLTALGLVA